MSQAVKSELRDWEKRQLLNFSHGNHLHRSNAPRLAREVLGDSLPAESEDSQRGWFAAGVAVGLAITLLWSSALGILS